MTNERFARLFDGPARAARDRHDPARDGPGPVGAGRDRTDRSEAGRARSQSLTGEKNLCLAGGVALNCVANGRILRESPFENIWIQPAAGDAGGALGAALHVWHQVQDNPRQRRGQDRLDAGRLPGPALHRRRDPAVAGSQGVPLPFPRWTTVTSKTRWPACSTDQKRRGPVPGPHGIRPPGAGQPLDHRRRPLSARCSRC